MDLYFDHSWYFQGFPYICCVVLSFLLHLASQIALCFPSVPRLINDRVKVDIKNTCTQYPSLCNIRSISGGTQQSLSISTGVEVTLLDPSLPCRLGTNQFSPPLSICTS
ncbi:hypothetical protein DL98DRAFT_516753 [Cadophora sp. DSE1049]|nr:hypothetical protein DL98DRAFT_516753 [Cadophora sp. DSE1049]